MSFAQAVKDETAHYPLDNKKSNSTELIAIINNIGRISVNNDITELKIMTESVLICRRFYELIKRVYAEAMSIDINKVSKSGKRNLYTATLSDKKAVVDIIEKLVNPEKHITDHRAYIRGSFLAIGSITDPEKDYHIEFVCGDMKNAKLIQEILINFELLPKIIKRKNDYIVYIKESEQIATTLNIIHSHNALLKFEDIRVKKELINNVNRVVNCETANLKKVVSASIKQISDINKLKQNKEYAGLPSSLKEVADTRLANPEASLVEIGEMLGISKSCVNHRLRKISKMAK